MSVEMEDAQTRVCLGMGTDRAIRAGMVAAHRAYNLAFADQLPDSLVDPVVDAFAILVDFGQFVAQGRRITQLATALDNRRGKLLCLTVTFLNQLCFRQHVDARFVRAPSTIVVEI